MRSVAEKVWTTGKKWIGNILPALVYFPLAATGATLIIVRQEFLGQGLWWLVASVVAGWLAMNFLALTGNEFLKRQLRRELSVNESIPESALFVGFSRPEFKSALDPHEDLGFLIVKPDRLIFLGENRRLEVARSAVERVGFRANPHTWVGLGRWVSIDERVKGKDLKLLIEPRERRTLLGNLRAGSELAAQLRVWKTSPAQTANPESKLGAP